MGLFGMSQSGKDAQNNLNALAGVLFGNGGEMADRSGNANNLAEFYTPILERLYKSLYENDAAFNPNATPDNWTGLGKTALPSIQTAMDNGVARYNGIVDPAFRGITSANATADQRRPYLDDAGTRVQSNKDDNGSTINWAANTMGARNDDASGEVRRSIGSTRDALTGDSNDTLGGIQTFNGRNFDTLSNALSDWYGGMGDRVNTELDPDNAAAARSTAPARAAALRRMRASGVAPDSVEGDALLGRVDSARARAFEDNRSTNIDKLNSLRREEFGIGSDLLQKKMANSEGLERDKLATRLSLGKDAADRTQAETLRSALYNNDLTKDWSTQTRANNDRYADQMEQFDQLMADEALGTRDRQQQDWQNAMTHTQAGNATDQNNVTLEGQRFGTGQGVYDKQLQQYLTGAQGLQGLWTGQQGYALGNNGQAQNGWVAAAQPYQQIYQNEAANSNWLGKGLMSLSGTAASGFTSGLGGGAAKKWFGGK